MKKIILILFIVFSCREERTLISAIQKESKISYYELIFEELNEIDIDKYYITYEIRDGFIIDDDFKSALMKSNLITDEEKSKLSDKFIVDNFSTYLSSKTIEIISLSKREELKKIQINHTFSKPYLINDSKILILCSVRFLHPGSNELRGGTDRAILFEKKDSNWAIDKAVDLIDY